MTEEQTPPAQPPRSAFAGCLILITMALVALVLISSAAWVVKKQSDSLASFTEIEALPAPVTPVAEHQAEFNSLASRLAHFQHEIENKRPAELTLSPLDLNLAVAHYEPLKDFRGQLSAENINDQVLSGHFHLPLRSTENLPKFVTSTLKIEPRPYNLNGTFTAVPLLTNGQLILNLKSVTPSHGEIPQPLFQGISRLLVSGVLPEDSPLQTLLSELTTAELREGALILGYHPDAKPPSAREEADAMATKAKQFAALGAVILILTMILSFILIARWKKNRRT